MGQSDGGGPRTNLASASEDAVIELARVGDMPAFEELVRRRQQQLRQLLRRLCNDASLADDLCQETFVRAWQSLPSLRVNAAFWFRSRREVRLRPGHFCPWNCDGLKLKAMTY